MNVLSIITCNKGTSLYSVHCHPGSKRTRQNEDDDFQTMQPIEKKCLKKTKDCSIGRKNIKKVVSRDLYLKRSSDILVGLMRSLNNNQLEAVRDLGFESLMHIGITEIPSKLAFWLLSNFEPISCSIVVDNNRKLHISEEDVFLTLGIPKGGIMMKEDETN